MISGFFKNNDLQEPIPSTDLFNVQTVFSVAEEYQPYIKLKASTKSEKRINVKACLLYTSPSPRDGLLSRMPSSA